MLYPAANHDGLIVVLFLCLEGLKIIFLCVAASYLALILFTAAALSIRDFSKGIGFHLKVLIVAELSAFKCMSKIPSIPFASRSNKAMKLSNQAGAIFVLGPL